MRQLTAWSPVAECRPRIALFRGGMLTLMAGAVLVVAGGAGGPGSSRAGKSDDVWSEVARIVQRHLTADPEYRTGDLVSQRQVEPIFDELLSLGFQPANHEELYDAVLPEQDRLVQLFNSVPGRKFIRQVSKLPSAYDRLERMTWTDVGRQLLDELIVAEDGPKRFAAIMSSDGLRKLQRLVEHDPRGRNLALPTGNIHTAEDLVLKLRDSKFVPKKQPTSP